MFTTSSSGIGVGAGVDAGLAPVVPYCRGSAAGGRVLPAPSETFDAANAAVRGGGVEPRPYDPETGSRITP